MSIVFGLFPFKIHSRGFKYRIEHSRLAVTYSLLSNLLLLIILGYGIKSSIAVLSIDFFKEKPLNGIINGIHVVLILLTIMVALFRNWMARKQILEICTELIQLMAHCFVKQQNCAKFNKGILEKAVLLLGKCIASIISTHLLATDTIWTKLIICGLGVIMQLIQFLVCAQFNFAVLYIYRCLWSTNMKIQSKLCCGGQYSFRVNEINKCCWIYLRLVRLIPRLTQLYQVQLLMITISMLASNVVITFFFLATWNKSGLLLRTFNNSGILFVLFLLNVFDFWQLVTACELLKMESTHSAVLLRELVVKAYLHKELMKNVSMILFL